MDFDELKQEITQCSTQEQDTLAAYLLYLRLKRCPKKLAALHHKVTDASLASWSEELFQQPDI